MGSGEGEDPVGGFVLWEERLALDELEGERRQQQQGERREVVEGEENWATDRGS